MLTYVAQGFLHIDLSPVLCEYYSEDTKWILQVQFLMDYSQYHPLLLKKKKKKIKILYIYVSELINKIVLVIKHPKQPRDKPEILS